MLQQTLPTQSAGNVLDLTGGDITAAASVWFSLGGTRRVIFSIAIAAPNPTNLTNIAFAVVVSDDGGDHNQTVTSTRQDTATSPTQATHTITPTAGATRRLTIETDLHARHELVALLITPTTGGALSSDDHLVVEMRYDP